MMGDNRDNSEDSRYWGFLPRDYVKGKALFDLLVVSTRTTERGLLRRGAVAGTRLVAPCFAVHFFTAHATGSRCFSQIRQMSPRHPDMSDDHRARSSQRGAERVLPGWTLGVGHYQFEDAVQ